MRQSKHWSVRPLWLSVMLSTSLGYGTAACRLETGRIAPERGVPAELAKSSMNTISLDQNVTFRSGELELHGSLRLPTRPTARVPATLIIAGSGPTDRNGNSAVAGHTLKLDTYAWLAEQLSASGQASLRYDKLGAGKTGLGPYRPADLATLSFQDTFVRHARAALAYLAARPGVDPERITVLGHSEGAMIALALANAPGEGPTPARLVLLEPQYAPILGILQRQLESKLKDATATGGLSKGDCEALEAWLKAGIADIVAGNASATPSTPPIADATGVAAQLQSLIRSVVFNPTNRTPLWTHNQLDPLRLATQVLRPDSVLVTCGTKDWNTPCAEVARLVEAFPSGVAHLVTLSNTVHELRDVGDASPAALTLESLRDAPFSTQLAELLRTL